MLLQYFENLVLLGLPFLFGSLGLEVSIAVSSLFLKRLVKSLILLSNVLSLSSPVAPLEFVVTEKVKSFTANRSTYCVQVNKGFSTIFFVLSVLSLVVLVFL